MTMMSDTMLLKDDNYERKRKFNRPVFKRFGNVINNVIMKG